MRKRRHDTHRVVIVKAKDVDLSARAGPLVLPGEEQPFPECKTGNEPIPSGNRATHSGRLLTLRDRGAGTPDAIIDGISSSAGVVTSAAVIMVAVFSIFATLSVIEFKMLPSG
jgi:hypothetical protein